MRKYFFLLIIIIFISKITLAQEIKQHPFSGKLVITAEGGLSVGKTDYMETINSSTFNGLAEYFFLTRNQNIFGIRLTSRFANIKGKDSRRIPEEFTTNISSIGLGLVYSYSIKDVVFPYAYGGFSFNWFDPKNSNGKRAPNNAKGLYDKNAFSYDLEAGIRFRINDNWSVLASGGIHFLQSDNLDDVSPSTFEKTGGFPAGPHYDFYATGLIGVSFSLFGAKDSDGDGVENSRDQCPDTPPGILIDENGCPLDTDGDGVPDYLDKCFGTLKGVQVNKEGCPLDSDKDGIPDYLDKCPDTPEGISVNNSGCPPDNDFDGVPDYKDKCTDTKLGLQVDLNGCPIDSDQDGVPDSVDKCPDTLPGTKVDQSGCEIKEETPAKKPSTQRETPKEEKPVQPNINVQPQVPERESVTSIPPNTSKLVINGDETFQTNSANIKSSAYSNLNNIVDYLSKDPWTKWKINGYVDSQVPDTRKLTLSYERADAILKYFISKGLPSFQFQVFGLGDEAPVSSNSTEEGRTKNNRVELVKIKK